MLSTIRTSIFAAACALLSVSSQADVLFERSPGLSALDGIQSDGATPAYQQSFPSLTGATLDKIVWWGFHGSNSGGSLFDSFEVFLGSTQLTGALTSSADFGGVAGLTEYVLDIVDTSLTAATIDIWNNSFDVEWFWQTVTPGSDLTAFRLEGTRGDQQIPEPGLLGLLGIAALALSLARHRKI